MKFYDIFTPGSPPHRKDFLVGRQDDLGKLINYLNSPGIHPIVVGPRGIGKTSLVQFVLDEYKYKSQIEANTVTNFDELARCILDDLGLQSHKLQTLVKETEETKEAKGKLAVAEGKLQHKKKTTESQSGLSNVQLSPQLLKRQLMSFKHESIISIDELDDLEHSDIPLKLAKFAKSCSNQSRWMKQKFIYSGIGRDAHSLFGAHLSSPRNHPVIYLAALKKDDFNFFLNTAEKKLHTVIPRHIRDDIISDADGFPYYMHQVCFHMFEIYEKDRSKVINNEHYAKAKKRAFDEAFSHFLRKYKYTVYRLQDLHKDILREMIVPKKRHYSYPTLEKHLLAECGYSLKDIKKHFRYLMDNGYIAFRKADQTVSLYDALLGPFLRIKLRLKDPQAISEPDMPLFKHLNKSANKIINSDQ